MVNLSEYQKQTFEGVIETVAVLKLEDWLSSKPNPLNADQMKEWNNLDRDHICVMISSGTNTVTDQFLIPLMQGYNKSNLKKFVDRNTLPVDTDKWVGKTVLLKVDGTFLRVAL